jgi:aspartate aminotransferase
VFDGGEAPSLVSIEPRLVDRVLLVNGVSKSYAMTGWRIGYAVGPAALIGAMNTLQSQMSSCPSSISQAATVAALDGDQSFVTECSHIYQSRRDLAVRMLNDIPGLRCLAPGGAFYVFPNVGGALGKRAPDGKRIETDLDLTMHLLDAAGVAAIHGGAYGLSPHLRLSIATSEDQIAEGCARIARALARLA